MEEPQPSKEELLARVRRSGEAWREIARTGAARADRSGAAGEWTLRDVLAHANAYHRFLVLELGGRARPFGDMPDEIGFDVQRRNEWLHAADLDRPWDDVVAEHDEVQRELVAQIEARSVEQLAEPMVSWLDMPIWRWVLDLTEVHLEEHRADLAAWFEREAPTG